MAQIHDFLPGMENLPLIGEEELHDAERWIDRAVVFTASGNNAANLHFLVDLLIKLEHGDAQLGMVLSGLERYLVEARTPWSTPSEECTVMGVQINALRLGMAYQVDTPVIPSV